MCCEIYLRPEFWVTESVGTQRFFFVLPRFGEVDFWWAVGDKLLIFDHIFVQTVSDLHHK